MQHETKITAFKGFDADMKCRGYQFEVGQTYEHDGPVKDCESGFHACLNPMDVWRYYDITGSRFAEVALSGETSTEDGKDSKIAAGRITIEAEISMPGFIKRAVAWVIDHTKGKDESGDSAQIGSSGNYAQIGSSGNYAQIGSSGYSAQIGSSGNSAQIGSSGNYAQIGSSGDSAQIGSSGDSAQIKAEGKNAVIACAGSATVSAAEGGAICIPYHDGERTRFAVGYVGENGIEAGKTYTVRDGQLVEVAQ